MSKKPLKKGWRLTGQLLNENSVILTESTDWENIKSVAQEYRSVFPNISLRFKEIRFIPKTRAKALGNLMKQLNSPINNLFNSLKHSK